MNGLWLDTCSTEWGLPATIECSDALFDHVMLNNHRQDQSFILASEHTWPVHLFGISKSDLKAVATPIISRWISLDRLLVCVHFFISSTVPLVFALHMKNRIQSINRMQSTVCIAIESLHADKIRREWQTKTQTILFPSINYIHRCARY